jgi:hypothetical protein
MKLHFMQGKKEQTRELEVRLSFLTTVLPNTNHGHGTLD